MKIDVGNAPHFDIVEIPDDVRLGDENAIDMELAKVGTCFKSAGVFDLRAIRVGEHRQVDPARLSDRFDNIDFLTTRIRWLSRL